MKKKQIGNHRFFLNITRDLGTYPISVNPLPTPVTTPYLFTFSLQGLTEIPGANIDTG